MKSSIILLSAAASVALAGPLDKRVLEIVTQTEVVYYTVTEEATASTPAAAVATPDFQGPNENVAVPVVVVPTTTTEAAPEVTVEVTVTPQAEVAAAPTTAEAETTTEAPVVTTTETPVVETTAAAEVEPTTTAAAVAAATPSDFASTAVYHHNIHRANNSAPDVTWGDTYATYAQSVSASCKFAHDLYVYPFFTVLVKPGSKLTNDPQVCWWRQLRPEHRHVGLL